MHYIKINYNDVNALLVDIVSLYADLVQTVLSQYGSSNSGTDVPEVELIYDSLGLASDSLLQTYSNWSGSGNLPCQLFSSDTGSAEII